MTASNTVCAQSMKDYPARELSAGTVKTSFKLLQLCLGRRGAFVVPNCYLKVCTCNSMP